MSDFRLDLAPLVWVHPETSVTILDEDMPDELRPDVVTYAEDALSVPLTPWQVAHLTHAHALTDRPLPRP